MALPPSDRHSLWRRVEADFVAAKERCPEGFRPVVTVYLAGMANPLQLGWVRTRKESGFPWVRFEVSKGVKPGDEDKPIDPNAFWVWARDEDVRRVEVRLEEKPPFDFEDFKVLEDDSSLD